MFTAWTWLMLKTCHKNDVPSIAVPLGVLVLLVVLCLRQMQVKNCTASAWCFIRGAPEFVLHDCTAESGENKVCSSTTLLLCALCKTAACGLGSFSIKEYRGVFLAMLNLLSCVAQTEFRNCACMWGLLPNAQRCVTALQRRRH